MDCTSEIGGEQSASNDCTAECSSEYLMIVAKYAAAIAVDLYDAGSAAADSRGAGRGLLSSFPIRAECPASQACQTIEHSISPLRSDSMPYLSQINDKQLRIGTLMVGS